MHSSLSGRVGRAAVCSAVVVLVALLVVSPVAAQPNLLVNGGFETGDFNGWTVHADDMTSAVGPNIALDFPPTTFLNPHTGNYLLGVASFDNNFTLAQQVTTLPGGVYNFSFWINYPFSDDPSDFVAVARFGDGPNVTLWAEFGSLATNAWVAHSALITAPSSGPTTLTVTMYAFDFSGIFALDDVSLVSLVIIPNPFTSSSSTGAVSSVRGDPQFVGLLGQSFQVHGMDSQVYNLIHDSTGLHVNALFVFLSAGECPAASVVSTACWSHPGSYLGTVGVVSAAGRRVSVVSGAAQSGFSAVAVDGAAVSVGDRAVYSDVSLSYTSSHELTINTGNYQLTLQNSDGFINIAALEVKQWGSLKTQQAHGLLGQTWQRPAAKGQHVKEIEGEVDDYAEASNELFGSNFGFVSTA